MSIHEERARAAIEALRWNGVDPVKAFIAPGGREAGIAEVWEVDVSDYAVKCQCRGLGDWYYSAHRDMIDDSELEKSLIGMYGDKRYYDEANAEASAGETHPQ